MGALRGGTLDQAMFAAEAPIHRLSFEDVQRMFETGVIDPDARVELIDGVLFDVTPPGPAHSAVVAWLNKRLVLAAGECDVRVQDVLIVAGGFLSPDLMVVERPSREQLPESALVAVEVAVTSHRHDRQKALRYAQANVAEYWLVDVPAQAVDVHRAPGHDGYADVARYRKGERFASVAIDVEIDVAELLGG